MDVLMVTLAVVMLLPLILPVLALIVLGVFLPLILPVLALIALIAAITSGNDTDNNIDQKK